MFIAARVRVGRLGRSVGDHHAGKLDIFVHPDGPLAPLRRLDHLDRRDLGAPLDRTEVASARDRARDRASRHPRDEDRVVWAVVDLIVGDELLARDRLEIGHPPDHRPVVRMRLEDGRLDRLR